MINNSINSLGTFLKNTLEFKLDDPESPACLLHISLYMPFVSVVTGAGLAIAGIVYAVAKPLFNAFSDAPVNEQEPNLGARAIVTGIIAMVPVAGNSALIIYECILESDFLKDITKRLSSGY